MSSLFTPVFFPKSTSNIRVVSSSSPSSTSPPLIDPIAAHTTYLSSIHLALSRLDPILCPPSPPGSPTPESLERISRLREQVLEAVDAADGERSSGKWSLVGRKLKMSCTRGRWGYREVLAQARMRNKEEDGGERVGSAVNHWILANTEDEWFEWERMHEEDRRRQEMNIDVAADERAEQIMVIDDDGDWLGMKERVKIWQQNVPVGVEPAPPSSLALNTQGESWPIREDAGIARKDSLLSDPAAAIVKPIPIPSSSLLQSTHNTTRQQQASVPAEQSKVKASARDRHGPSLGFPVVKRSSMTSTSGKKPNPTPVQQPKDTRNGKGPPSPAKIADSDVGMASSNPIRDMPPPADVVSKIGNISERSFLPPSFPSEMKTSTPKGKKVPIHEKPPPITSSSPPFPSSPGPAPPSTSSHSPNIPDDVNISLSLPPPPSPHQQPAKRPRESISPSQTSSGALPTSSSPPKKARTMSELVSDDLVMMPVPPSTPPPAAKLTLGGKGLGNAKGLPIPSTPGRQLPTLTELLASSRRSKPRPRPPSRAVKAGGLPFTNGHADEDMRLHTPDPSPAKSMFSSPASGSTMTPASMIVQLRSPATPTFTQNPSAFAPDFVSSQAPLEQGSSGFLGMGYNSQFDVEGQVDRVSELLEKDVDFDGWLRDIPAMEDES